MSSLSSARRASPARGVLGQRDQGDGLQRRVAVPPLLETPAQADALAVLDHDLVEQVLVELLSGSRTRPPPAVIARRPKQM